MKTLIIILFACLSASAQIVNQYGTLTGGTKQSSGTTFVDLKESANGTCNGTVKPVFNTNGYATFVGGSGLTDANRGRIDIALATYQYAYNTSSTFVCIFRSSKSDANSHSLYGIGRFAIDYQGILTLINSTENISSRYRTDIAGVSKLKIGDNLTNICDGKWHISVIKYTANVATFYIDNIVIALITNESFTSGNFYTASSLVSLGASFSSGSNFINDLTGDIAFFSNANAAYTNAQVANIQNEFLMLY